MIFKLQVLHFSALLFRPLSRKFRHSFSCSLYTNLYKRVSLKVAFQTVVTCKTLLKTVKKTPSCQLSFCHQTCAFDALSFGSSSCFKVHRNCKKEIMKLIHSSGYFHQTNSKRKLYMYVFHSANCSLVKYAIICYRYCKTNSQ